MAHRRRSSIRADWDSVLENDRSGRGRKRRRARGAGRPAPPDVVDDADVDAADADDMHVEGLGDLEAAALAGWDDAWNDDDQDDDWEQDRWHGRGDDGDDQDGYD